MPPRLPDRYRLNIRLGSDGDIEEWLARDDELDRPVLIRYLAPESDADRRTAFLDSVRAAAAVTDVHLQRVFAAADTTASAFSVSEWDGGVTIADRLTAGDAIPVPEFIASAAGLSGALARFHATGGLHGAIDTSAVHYSAAHPVKLGAFGRQRRYTDQAEDTKALAEVFRAAITGSPDPSVMPSTVIDGVAPDVDRCIMAALAGEIDAGAFASELASIEQAPQQEVSPARPWRMLVVFGLIVAIIAFLGAVGLATDFDPDSPFLYPVTGEQSTPSITTPTVVIDEAATERLPVTVTVYDPLGDGVESDASVDNAIDGDRTTSWSTEAYSRPIRDIKEGVGLVFDVAGTPSMVSITGAEDTTYLVGWAQAIPEDPNAWQHIGRGTLRKGEIRMHLPLRGGGVWRIWLTDLPQQPDGSYRSQLNDVSFS